MVRLQSAPPVVLTVPRLLTPNPTLDLLGNFLRLAGNFIRIAGNFLRTAGNFLGMEKQEGVGMNSQPVRSRLGQVVKGKAGGRVTA